MPARRRLGLLFAAAAGIAIALMDSRPGFDATGLTVVALIATASLAVVIANVRSVGLAVVVGLLVGIWVPIIELSGSAGAASLAASAFAIAGALGGAAVVRVLSGGMTVR